MNSNNSILKPIWVKFFKSAWILGFVLILFWGIPRFFIVLMANQSGNYQWVSLVFVSMWFTPWIFLSRFGRFKIGLRRPNYLYWLIIAFLLGALACTFMFLIANLLYQESISNWFVYISNSYSNIPQNIIYYYILIFFLIYAAVSMIFSPFVEEFLYRGIIHECFADKWNDQLASILDSLAFSLTHLAHFGIIYHLGHWEFLFVPSLIWVILLFFTCIIFSFTKKRSGSILGAIMAHAGFNFAMIYFIFFHII